MKRHTKKEGFVMKNGRGMRGWRWTVFVTFIFATCTTFVGGLHIDDVSAGTGAKIGSNSNYESGNNNGGSDPGNNGGGNRSKCTPGTSGGVDCMGVSWIYYSATGNAGESGTEVVFSPQGHGGVAIPAECSLPGRGFWAYGVGAHGFKYGGKNVSVIQDSNGKAIVVFRTSGFDYKNNINYVGNQTGNNKSPDVYSTSAGKNGLQGIYPWAWQGSQSAAVSSRKYATFGDANLDHTIYRNINGTYTAIYTAKKYGVIGNSNNPFINARSLNLNESNPEVWLDFKKAYRYLNGSEWTGTNFPDDLNFFCSWEFEDPAQNDMRIQAFDIENWGDYLGDDGIGLEDRVSGKVTNGGTATLTMPQYDNNSNWKFVCNAWWNGTTWVCFEPYSTTLTQTISGNDQHPAYVAFYKKKHTMKLEAYDVETGRYLGSEISDVTATNWLWESVQATARTATPKWEFQCVAYWDDLRGWTCGWGNSSTATVDQITGAPVYRAYYKQARRTLTGVPVDTGGNRLDGTNIIECRRIGVVGPVTVKYGESASVTRNTNSCYDFLGWSTSVDNAKAGRYATTGVTYTVNSLTSDTTAYAVYRLQDRTLTVKAYDTAGKYLGASSGLPVAQQIADITVSKKCGDTASVTRGTNVGYVFKGWKLASSAATGYFTTTNTSSATYVSGSLLPKETYNVKSLVANGTVYAIYELRNITLTGKAVDGQGNSLAGVTGLGDKTHTVKYWQSAQVTRGTAEGYTFYGWAESLNNAKNGTYITRTSGTTYISAAGATTYDNAYNSRGVYHVASMTDSSITPVYARYDRNEFQGRARASGGTSVSESNNTSTDWVETNTSRTLTIECPNDGCKATFDLHLKTVKGLGKTYYSVSRSKNGGSYGAVTPITPASPYAPSTGGTAINKTTGNYTETLYPGETVCYRLSFRPYGAYSNTTTANATACVSAKVSTFEGKSSVTGATTGTTDWQKTSRTETAFIQNCSPTAGCQVSFNHRLKRTDGSMGWTDYVVKRTSNMTVSDKAIANNNNVKSGTFNTTESEVSSSGPFTLYPGMVVCESLTFRPNNSLIGNTYNTANVTTKICASALGNAQPDDPTPSECTGTNCEIDPDCPKGNCSGEVSNKGSDALVDIEVRNNSVTKYNTFRRVVYGKPGDSLTYRGTYNPNLQYTYDLIPEQMQINGGTIYPSSNGTNTTRTLATMFNAVKSPRWNNDIIIYSTNFTNNSFSQTYNYTNGSTAKHQETNDHNVVTREVGRSLNENAEINYPSNNSIKTTPVQVLFKNNNGKNLGDVSTVRKYRIAYARIPYNYDTGIEVPTPEPEKPTPSNPDPGDPNEPASPENPDNKVPVPEIVYAGEDKQVNVTVDIKPKGNSVTNNPGDPDYATKTGKSTVKLIIYLTDDPKAGTANYSASRDGDLCGYYGKVNSEVSENWNCSNFVAKEQNLNSAGNMNGETTTFPSTFNIPDLDAGKKICVAAAIYPSNSGLETNWDSMDGSNTWRISNSRCFVVAKRPNLQVLGGSMYSAGNLVTSVAAKRNVYGVYPVKLDGTYRSNTTIFGSWVEHQIVSVGNTAGIASGASTGYFGTTSSTVPASGRTPKDAGLDAKGRPGLGGSKEGASVDYCIRVPLTIANTNSAIPCKGRTIVGGYITSSNATNPSDKEKLIAKLTQNTDESGIEYIRADGDYTVGAMTTTKGLTKVIHATGNINITGNLIYEDNYTSLTQIPKLIIYAEGNINIDCYVTRIDAVLIAGRTNGANGVVNTCPTSYSVYTGDITSAINWKYNGTTLINTRANSNPLTINGTIIANRLIANRTYGAAKGVNSIVPAEVIDYDTTLYGWGVRESDASASGKLQTVYLHEVAPRY